LSHVSVKSEQQDDNQAALLVSLENLPTDSNKAIVKTGTTTLGQLSIDLSAYLKLDQTTPQTTVGTFTFPKVVVNNAANSSLTFDNLFIYNENYPVLRPLTNPLTPQTTLFLEGEFWLRGVNSISPQINFNPAGNDALVSTIGITSTGSLYSSSPTNIWNFSNTSIYNIPIASITTLKIGQTYDGGADVWVNYGVSMTAVDGVLTIKGLKDAGNNENLTFDFETTANKVAIGSTTGVTDITFGALNLGTTGIINANGGSIKSSTGAISFDNENLSTTGTLGAGATTITGNLTFSGAARTVTTTNDGTNGYALTFQTAAGSNSPLGSGGNLTFQGGASGVAGSGVVAGGSLFFYGGTGQGGQGSGGNLTFLSGAATGGGFAGTFTLGTGSGAAGSGNVSIISGTATGNTGTITIASGAASGGSSGAISFKSGTGVSTSGAVTIGSANATNTSGLLTLITGTATSKGGILFSPATAEVARFLGTGTGLRFLDNKSAIFGTGSDATIYYDATNLVINPKEVGVGTVNILGTLTATGDMRASGGRVLGNDFSLRDGMGADVPFMDTVSDTPRLSADYIKPYTAGGTINVSGAVAMDNKITTYNNVATEGYGVPAIVDDVALTAQSASIGSTNFTNAGTAGNYRLNYYLEATTLNVGATSILLTVSFTDDAGATTVTSAALPLTALGRTSGVFFIRLASGSVSYSTTLIDATGLARYALYMSLECLR
jgi:hypothetical protein